jgi:hypothetical protein
MNSMQQNKCDYKSWCCFPDCHDDDCMPLNEIIAGNPLEPRTTIMLTDLFKHMTFDDVKKYSDVISDVNTFYAYRHIAMITTNAVDYAKHDADYNNSIEKLKYFLTEFYNKSQKKK